MKDPFRARFFFAIQQRFSTAALDNDALYMIKYAEWPKTRNYAGLTQTSELYLSQRY